MVERSIVKYLNEGLHRGFGINFLKKKLLEGGFGEIEVREAAAFVQGYTEAKFRDKFDTGKDSGGKEREGREERGDVSRKRKRWWSGKDKSPEQIGSKEKYGSWIIVLFILAAVLVGAAVILFFFGERIFEFFGWV